MSSLIDLNRKREEEIGLSPSMKEAIIAKNKQNAAKGIKLAQARRSGTPSPAGKGMSGQAAGGAAVSALQAAGVGGEGAGGAESAAMGAASGALAGASMGPVGAGVGAVVGGTIGLLKARSARKKRAREAAAKAHANIGAIRQQEQRDISGALENIRQGFQSSLIRNSPQVRF